MKSPFRPRQPFKGIKKPHMHKPVGTNKMNLKKVLKQLRKEDQ